MLPEHEGFDADDWANFRYMKKRQNTIRRERNKADSKMLLERYGIKFEEKNNGYHLIVTHGETVTDFYPSTGKFLIRKGRYGRGVFNLIRELGIERNPEYER